MKRRILSLVTALALCLGLLPGTALAAEKLEDKSGGFAYQLALYLPKQTTVYSAGEGTITWEPETSEGVVISGKLTLHNAEITVTDGSSGIAIPVDTELVLEGSSSITMKKPGIPILISGREEINPSLTIRGDGSLDVTAIGDSDGIQVAKNLNIVDNANVSVTCSPLTAGVVTILGGINIEDSTVKVKLQGDIGKTACAIESNHSGNPASDLTINNSHVIAINPVGYALKASKSLLFTNSDVVYIGKSPEDEDGWSTDGAISFGRYKEGKISVSGGSLYAQNNYNNTGNYNYGYDIPYLPDFVTATDSAAIYYNHTYRLLIQNGNNVQYRDCSYDEATDTITVGNGYVIGDVEWNDNIVFGESTQIQSFNQVGSDKVVGNITIPSGVTVTVPKGCEIRNYGTFTNNGTLVLEDYFQNMSDPAISGSTGKVINNGTITITETGDMRSAGSITNNGTLTNEGIYYHFPTGTIDGSEPVTNDGTVVLMGATVGDAASETIKGMNLTGSGVVRAGGTDTGNNHYTNDGIHILNGGFDFTNPTTLPGVLETDGYHWDAAEKTLTLDGVYITGTVKLPNDVKKIITTKPSNVKNLTIVTSPYAVNVTFEGKGPLTVQDQINISGSNGNIVTVATDAELIAMGGITVCADGAVDGSVIVNGKLTAIGEENNAVLTGKVAIGEKGTLDVSGKEGVSLNGMNDTGFDNVFTIKTGGEFAADCSEYNILVSGSVHKFTEDELANVFDLPPSYKPTGCDLTISKEKNAISYAPKDGQITFDYGKWCYVGALNGQFSLHELHNFADTWSNNTTDHWKECLYSGCYRRAEEDKHYYTDDADQYCDACEFERIPDHIHVWSDKWERNDTHHWHECTADNCPTKKKDNATHTWGEDNRCTECDYEKQTDPQPGHTHSWSTTTWGHDTTHHWHNCTTPGCPITNNSEKDGYAEHSFTDGVCICGYQEGGEVHGHTYDGWSSDADNHWHICTICHEIADTAPHDWNGNTCETCGAEKPADAPQPEQPDPPAPPVSTSSSRPYKKPSAKAATYPITIEPADHGRVRANRSTAASGTTVTLTVTPDSGYTLDDLSAFDSSGNSLRLSGSDSKFTFTMPASAVTVEAEFAPLPSEAPEPPSHDTECPSHAFPDLDTGEWYHNAVDFALSSGLMGGTGSGFAPGAPLSRAMLAQILWNHAGEPSASVRGAFPDAPAGEWYTDAADWAASAGIVSGFSDGSFRPDANVTREQFAVMLWHYAGSPAASGTLSFADTASAGSYALDALRWAVSNGILSGKSGGLLDPTGPATRAEAAQMLYNFITLTA